MSNERSEIFVVCAGCLKYFIDWEGEPIFLPVIKLPASTLPTINGLINQWYRVNFLLEVPGKKIVRSVKCPFAQNLLRSNIKEESNGKQVNVADCIKNILQQYLCQSCFEIFKNVYQKQGVSGILSHNHIVPYDVHVNEIRFTRFIEKPSSKMANVSILTLLQPLSLTGWITVLVVICFLGAMLKATGFQTNPYYWLFVTLIEQGDDRTLDQKRSNWFLILSWLVVLALLLRNIYTSSLYTFMTKDPGPPKRVAEKTNLDIFADKSIRFFTHSLAYNEIHLWHKIWTSQDSSKNNGFTEQENIAHVIENLASSQNPAMDINILLNETNGKLRCDYPSFYKVGKDFNSKVSQKTCLSKEKFTFVSTTVIYEAYGHKLAINKMLIHLLNKYYLFETIEPGVFSTFLFWSSHLKSFAQLRIQKLFSALSESGLLQIQKKYYGIWKLKDELKSSIKEYNSSKRKIAKKGLRKWVGNDCFRLYKEVYNLDDINEDWSGIGDPERVGVEDLKVAWIIYAAAICFTSVTFFIEMGAVLISFQQMLRSYVRLIPSV